MPIEQTHTAKSPYICNDCHKEIEPGQTYVRVAFPAWEDWDGDVGDDGHPVAWLRDRDERRWYVQRFHDDCFWRYDK